MANSLCMRLCAAALALLAGSGCLVEERACRENTIQVSVEFLTDVETLEVTMYTSSGIVQFAVLPVDGASTGTFDVLLGDRYPFEDSVNFDFVAKDRNDQIVAQQSYDIALRPTCTPARVRLEPSVGPVVIPDADPNMDGGTGEDPDLGEPSDLFTPPPSVDSSI